MPRIDEGDLGSRAAWHVVVPDLVPRAMPTDASRAKLAAMAQRASRGLRGLFAERGLSTPTQGLPALSESAALAPAFLYTTVRNARSLLTGTVTFRRTPQPFGVRDDPAFRNLAEAQAALAEPPLALDLVYTVAPKGPASSVRRLPSHTQSLQVQQNDAESLDAFLRRVVDSIYVPPAVDADVRARLAAAEASRTAAEAEAAAQAQRDAEAAAAADAAERQRLADEEAVRRAAQREAAEDQLGREELARASADEERARTVRTVAIVGGSLAGATILALGLYFGLRKRPDERG